MTVNEGFEMKIVFAAFMVCTSAACFAQLDFYETGYVLQAGISGSASPGVSSSPSLSPNGKYVSFVSSKFGLRTSDAYRTNDVFVRNVSTGGVSSRNKHLGKQIWLGFDRSQIQRTFVLNDQSRTYYKSPDPIPGPSGLPSQLYYYDNITGNSVLVSAPTDSASTLLPTNLFRVSDDGKFALFGTNTGLYLRDQTEPFSRLIQSSVTHGAVMSRDGASVLYGMSDGIWRYRNGVKQRVLARALSGKRLQLLWTDGFGTKAIVQTDVSFDPLDLADDDIYQLDFTLNTVQKVLRPSGLKFSRAIDVAKSGNYIAVCPYGTSVMLYDVRTKAWRNVSPKYQTDDYPNSVSVDDAGANIAVGTEKGDSILVRTVLKTQSNLDDVGQKAPAEDIAGFCVTPDERFAALKGSTIFSDGKYRSVRRDLSTGADVVIPNNLEPLALSDNGRYIVGRHYSINGTTCHFVDLKLGFIHDLGSNTASMDRSGMFTVYERSNQIYLYDYTRKEERLLSRTTDGRPGSGYSEGPKISADGTVVFFTSTSRDLVGGFQSGSALNSVFRWSRLPDKLESIQLPNPGTTVFNVNHLATNATGSRILYMLLHVGGDAYSWPIFYDLTTRKARYLPQDYLSMDYYADSMDAAGEHVLFSHSGFSFINVMRYSDLKRDRVKPTEWYMDVSGLHKGALCNGRRLWALTGGVLLKGKFEFR